MPARVLALEAPYDLRATWAPLRAGPRDPTLRLADREALRATRTPCGPAALHARVGSRVELAAWGPGAEWVLERAPDLLGLWEAPPAPPAAAPAVLRRLARRAAGLRLPRTHAVVEALALLVLQQKVSGRESERAWTNLVRATSEPAPGPFAGLWLPPASEALRDLAGARLPVLGILARQGATLREVGRRARRLDALASLPPQDAAARLGVLPGVGPWTAQSLALHALGDADAVPLGDWNLPHAVAFHLAGEERADDSRMLTLLAPYAGQRGRVLRWILSAGRRVPRRGPRMPLRPLPDARDTRGFPWGR